jgi:multiple sugar transport system ATP-binding protein
MERRLPGTLEHGQLRTALGDVRLESLGADKYAYFHIQGARATAQELEELAADAGTSDAPGGSDQVVARLDPASRAREGRQLQLWFDPAKLHLFNPDNGAHLTL